MVLKILRGATLGLRNVRICFANSTSLRLGYENKQACFRNSRLKQCGATS